MLLHPSRNIDPVLSQEIRDLSANRDIQEFLKIVKLISDTTLVIEPKVLEAQRPVVILRETWKETTFVQPAP